MEKVDFISTEDGDDLIVSFAIPEDFDIRSLTLLRTPKYEPILDEHERGVSVSFEYDDVENDLLLKLTIECGKVALKTQNNEYLVDIHTVDPDEIESAKGILEKMNFDNSFEYSIV